MRPGGESPALRRFYDFARGLVSVANWHQVRHGMNETTTKTSRATRQLSAGRDARVCDDDPAMGTLKYLSARNKSVALRSDTSATLCFIRGSGKMAVRDASIEYHDGKWFEIPDMTEYRIFPEADTVLLTVLLTIQKPEERAGHSFNFVNFRALVSSSSQQLKTNQQVDFGSPVAFLSLDLQWKSRRNAKEKCHE